MSTVIKVNFLKEQYRSHMIRHRKLVVFLPTSLIKIQPIKKHYIVTLPDFLYEENEKDFGIMIFGKSCEILPSYEEWYEENEDSFIQEWIETGADRELDFDSEKEINSRYDSYVQEWEIKPLK